MTPTDEDLSRLLDGDLPPEAAAALWERLRNDPDAAARLARMQAIRADLDAIAEEAPPAWLDRAVLERTHHAEPRTPLAAWLLPALALAAGLLVGARFDGPPPEILLEAGSQRIDGDAMIHAGDVGVKVDGRARVTVEPVGGVARGSRGEEEAMNPLPYAASALAGAVITVAVYEGTAVVESPGQAPVAVSPGQTREFTHPGAAAPTTADEPIRDAPVPVAPAPAATEAPEDLTTEVARLRFENALYRGQLARLQGEPNPWPAQVPPHLAPDAFEAAVRSGAESAGLGPVVGVDCDEYPCIAFVELPTGQEPDALRAAAESLAGAVGGTDEDARLWTMMAVEHDGERSGGMLALSVLPPGGEGSGDNQRVGYRAEGFMEAWSEP